MKKLLIWLSILAFFFSVISCQQPVNDTIAQTTGDTYVTNTINIIWKGSFSSAPINPEVGWAYYDTTKRMSFVWDGSSWQIIAQDGKSIVWKGELSSAPSNPEENWAYYNIIDGNSYIFNGHTWDYLAKSGRDGASGIMLWLGSFDTAPSNPSTGYCYYNTTNKCSYIWDGDSWEIIAHDGTDGISGKSIVWKGVLSTAPQNPQEYWAYYNTTTQTSYIFNGTSWDILSQSIGGNTTVQVLINWRGTFNAAPLNPNLGDAYYNSTTKCSYIYDGSIWQQISKDGEDGTYTYSGTGYLITWKGSLSSAPSSPQKGWAYYNSTERKSYIWDGSSWQIMAQDGSGTNASSAYSYLYVLCYTSENNYIHSLNQPISEVNFGAVGLNSTSKTTTFYISMQSSTKDTFKLTGIPAIQISGTNADCFSAVQPSITEITTGSYIMDAAILFSPTSLGEKTATITIPNNSPDYPNFSFTVKGTGAYWPKTFDGGEGDGNDAITCSAEDSQGNLYFVGYGFELVNDHSGYDWWIKKFDKYGVEDTINWNKKTSFYDDYSAIYDCPSNLLIDSEDNIVVSSQYVLSKYSYSGELLWNKQYNNDYIKNIYIDTDNAVYVGKASSILKISSNGDELFTINPTGNISFDQYNNILITNDSEIALYSCSTGELIRRIEISEISEVTASEKWIESSINSMQGEYFCFPVTKLKHYAIQMNNGYSSNSGDGTKTGNIKLSAYYLSTGSSIFSNKNDLYYSPNIFETNEDDFVILKSTANNSNDYGSYAVRVITSVSGRDISSGWESGNLSSTNQSKTYYYNVEKGKTYVISYNDYKYGDGTKTGKIAISASYSDGTVILSSTSGNLWDSGKFFIAEKNDAVKLTASLSDGANSSSFSVALSEVEVISTMEKHLLCQPIVACFDTNNNIYVTGIIKNYYDRFSRNDVFINKYNSSYSLEWSNKYDWGHCENEQSTEIYYQSGQIVVLGTGNDLINGATAADSWCKTLNPAGSILSSFNLDIENITLISTYENNYYFVGGSSSYYNAVYKVSPNGSIISRYGLNSNNQSIISNPKYLISNIDGSVYQAGYNSNLVSSKSGYDWQIIKY